MVEIATNEEPAALRLSHLGEAKWAPHLLCCMGEGTVRVTNLFIIKQYRFIPALIGEGVGV